MWQISQACSVSFTSLIVIHPVVPYFVAVWNAATPTRTTDCLVAIATLLGGVSLKYCSVAFSFEMVVVCGDAVRHSFAQQTEVKLIWLFLLSIVGLWSRNQGSPRIIEAFSIGMQCSR